MLKEPLSPSAQLSILAHPFKVHQAAVSVNIPDFCMCMNFPWKSRLISAARHKLTCSVAVGSNLKTQQGSQASSPAGLGFTGVPRASGLAQAVHQTAVVRIKNQFPVFHCLIYQEFAFHFSASSLHCSFCWSPSPPHEILDLCQSKLLFTVENVNCQAAFSVFGVWVLLIWSQVICLAAP